MEEEWEIYDQNKVRIKVVQTDLGDDMKHRPKLFRFLKYIQKELLRIPYELIKSSLAPSLKCLSPYEKELIHDLLILNWAVAKIATKNGISRTITYIHLKRAEDNLRTHIYQILKKELPGGLFENRKTKSRHRRKINRD